MLARVLSFFAGASIVVATTTLTGDARAQPDSANEDRARALATDLFDRGVKLMVAHKCDEATVVPEADRAACAESLGYFVKATREYPKAIGAYRNAAFVAKGLGKVALAARSFREVARRAPLETTESRKRWAEPAQKEAEALEPRVPHLVVKIDGPLPADVKVSLDGDPIDKTLLATPIALDPGEHVVRAEATERVPAETRVTLVEKDAREVVLTLPVVPKEAKVAALPAPPPPPPPPRAKSQLAPILVTSAGGALAVVGLVFGGMAKGTRDAGCDVAAGTCRSQSDIDKAKSQATVSTVLTIAGAAIAAGGAVWWIAGPKYERPAVGFSPLVTPSGGGLVATAVLR